MNQISTQHKLHKTTDLKISEVVVVTYGYGVSDTHSESARSSGCPPMRHSGAGAVVAPGEGRTSIPAGEETSW